MKRCCIPNSIGNLNAIRFKIPAFAYRVDTINYNILLSLYAAGHGSFSQLILFLAVFKNATHFGAPKYPKRFVIRWLSDPAMSLLHNLMRIKKTVTLHLIRYCVYFLWSDWALRGLCSIFFKKLNYRLWTQNHCVSGLLLPFLLLCTCFFDFTGSWDWRRSSVKPVCY